MSSRVATPPTAPPRSKGERERIIAVFSYYEAPGVVFSETERLGFPGRTVPADH